MKSEHKKQGQKAPLGDSNSVAMEGIDAHLLELQQERLKLANAKQNYDTIADEIDELRVEKEELLLQEANKDSIHLIRLS